MIKIVFLKLKELGPYVFFIRFLHKLLSIFGFYWESSYLLVQNIDIDSVNAFIAEHSDLFKKYVPGKLSYSDFLLSNKKEFTDEKMVIIRSRFENENLYTSYGVKIKDKLIYSCWTYTKELVLSYNTRLPMQQQALLLDDFCEPAYRRLGIHTMMIFFRLKYLYCSGKNNVAVLVHTYNKPALKSQIRAGFIITEKITVIKLGRIKKVFRKTINKKW